MTNKEEINWEEIDKKYWIETLTLESWKVYELLEKNPNTWIFTLWHSNHNIELFIELLQSQKITFMLDVRKYAWSKYNTQYNQKELAASLKEVWIDYAHAKVLWWFEWAETNERLFKATIERLIERSKTERVCMVCSEWDPYPNKYLSSGCHRWWKLSRYILENYKENVFHIMKDFRVDLWTLEEYKTYRIDKNWDVIK